SASTREAVLVPGWFVRFEPFCHLASRSELRLRVEQSKLSVTFFLEKPEAVTASKKILDLRCESGQRRLSLKHVAPLGRVFILTYGDPMSVLLPGATNI